jgi:hypothetical protein
VFFRSSKKSKKKKIFRFKKMEIVVANSLGTAVAQAAMITFQTNPVVFIVIYAVQAIVFSAQLTTAGCILAGIAPRTEAWLRNITHEEAMTYAPAQWYLDTATSLLPQFAQGHFSTLRIGMHHATASFAKSSFQVPICWNTTVEDMVIERPSPDLLLIDWPTMPANVSAAYTTRYFNAAAPFVKIFSTAQSTAVASWEFVGSVWQNSLTAANFAGRRSRCSKQYGKSCIGPSVWDWLFSSRTSRTTARCISRV